jgi:hypothetical protein
MKQMIFKIKEKETKDNLANLMKKAGYFCLGRGRDENDLSFVRSIHANNYPRFHVIIRTDKGKDIIFDIHLDQKKPIYKGTRAHSAEYDGPVIENEASRIKTIALE